ncbi:MAG: Lrp/AsnC family transcriptional regulator [Desulfobacter sp.]|nr:MAG: Lrp/AsnC family transcriptional regulator [Desulfobacter sp.]
MLKKKLNKLDETDRAILREVLQDGRISNNELARRINLSQPAAHARLRRLQSAGVIQGFTVRLDYEELGYELACFFHIRLRDHAESDIEGFEKKVAAFPDVMECHYLTGEWDYLIKAVFQSRRALEHFMRNRLSAIPGVAQIVTSLVLSEIKTGNALSLTHDRKGDDK